MSGQTGYYDAIKFPATQVSSSDVNTLDDYEEGTKTVTLTAATPPDTPPTCEAVYTKIGRVVTISGFFSNVNTVGAAGAMSITGLPFAAGGEHVGSVTMAGQGSAVAVITTSAASTILAFLNAVTIAAIPIVAAENIYIIFTITYSV